MARYQVSIVEAAPGWQPASLDDVPPDPGHPKEVLAETDDLFAAVREAIDHNQRAQQEGPARWAVVVEPGSPGRTWPGLRLCTPLAYGVTAVWWPTGWEPQSPLDVPNCVLKAHGEPGEESFTYQKAVALVRSLNHQSIDHVSPLWYVVVAEENEPVSQTVSYDPSGNETTVEARRLHVVRPERGGGKGDCSHCPAHGFDCAKEDWITLEQTVTATSTRRLHPTPPQ